MMDVAKRLIPGAIIGVVASVASISAYELTNVRECVPQLTHFVDDQERDIYIAPSNVLMVSAGATSHRTVLHTMNGDARVVLVSPSVASKMLGAYTSGERDK